MLQSLIDRSRILPAAIIEVVARGWESKAVEAQQAEASEAASSPRKPVLSPEEKLKLQKREGLLLNRKRIAHQLEGVTQDQYRSMLQAALADLDRRIAELG